MHLLRTNAVPFEPMFLSCSRITGRQAARTAIVRKRKVGGGCRGGGVGAVQAQRPDCDGASSLAGGGAPWAVKVGGAGPGHRFWSRAL